MSRQTNINVPVTVTAIGFGKNMRAYPRRIEYAGATYSFIDSGLRTVVVRGEKTLAQILTMSDGIRNFCLRCDNSGGGVWTLISIL